MRVLFVVDQAMQNKFPGPKVNEVINGVLAHTRTLFAHGSLTTNILIEMVGVEMISETLHAGGQQIM